jgi:RNA polymerase sigma factor (sigma-70 family)
MRSILTTDDFTPEKVEDEGLLWADFKQGDKAAYAYFYSKYASLLFRYGCKVMQDKELVKDCLHDLFTELWRNKANLSVPPSVKNYLIKSLRNKLVRELTKQSRFVDEESVPEIELGVVSSHEFEIIHNQNKTEQERQLVAAIKKLTNKQKEIIFLLYYNNLSPAEVAAIMSVSVRTIYNTTFSAIQVLKGELAAVLLIAITKDLFQ